MRSRNRAQSADQKFAANHHHRHPRGNECGIELHQCDECGSNEQLVGQRIEEHAHGRDLAAFARQIAINAIGDGGEDENDRSENLSLAGPRAEEARSAKYPYEERDGGDAGERDGVWKVHAMTGPWPRGRLIGLSSTSETKAMYLKTVVEKCLPPSCGRAQIDAGTA